MQKVFRKAIAVTIVALTAAASSAAMAVPFKITGASFITGTGYGTETENQNSTRLDVRFSTAGFTTKEFDLTMGDPTRSFVMGSINFAETNNSNGIRENERDQLGVSARFTFELPGAGPRDVTAGVNAVAGSVQDEANDYFIDWNFMDVSFGTTGLYRISLTDMAFDNDTRVQNQMFTVTLLREDTQSGTVPEPSSLALAGLGLLTLGGFTRRRKQ